MTAEEKLIEREIRNAREGADYLRVAASRLDRLHDPEGVAKQHMENGAGYLDRAATALSAQQREIAELRKENRRLKATLQRVADADFLDIPWSPERSAAAIARAALNKQDSTYELEETRK